MTAYNLKPPQDPTPSPWQEARAQRRQQLAQVRNRRRLIYQLMRKMQDRKKTMKSSYF